MFPDDFVDGDNGVNGVDDPANVDGIDQIIPNRVISINWLDLSIRLPKSNHSNPPPGGGGGDHPTLSTPSTPPAAGKWWFPGQTMRNDMQFHEMPWVSFKYHRWRHGRGRRGCVFPLES